MQRITSMARRAIEDYQLIKSGDKIAVGVSGGKDSLTLLAGLANLQRFLPQRFELVAITIDMGFENVDYSPISDYCAELGVEYILHKTNIAKILFDIRNESNPCALCANLRRGALHNVAIANNARVIALGHHNDDVIETFFMSLMFEGRLHNFSPKTHLDRKNILMIRPLLYVSERDIIRFARRKCIPIVHNPCPANGHTKRQYVKELIATLDRENRGFKRRLFVAMRNGLDDWKL